MFMNQLVENWKKAKEQVLGKEEFVSGEADLDFVDTIKIYYFFPLTFIAYYNNTNEFS